MISRRNLLKLGAAAGIYAPPIRKADAFWHGQAGGLLSDPSNAISRNMTQVKPQGIPTLDFNHPLTNGLLVDLFDLGNGQYINLCEGNRPLCISNGPATTAGTPQSMNNGSTRYGAASHWPGVAVGGGFAQPGIAELIQVNLGDLSIPNANGLSVKGIGAGNTIACGIMRDPGTIANIYSWIFGRLGVSAGEVLPYYAWGFTQPGGFNVIYAECIDSGPNQIQIGNTYTCPDNQYTSLLATCQNTSASPGTGTATFAVNGVSNGTTANVPMFSYNPASIAETDLQLGTAKHMQTAESVNMWGGYIFWGRVWTRSLKATEWMYLHNHPYSIYL